MIGARRCPDRIAGGDRAPRAPEAIGLHIDPTRGTNKTMRLGRQGPDIGTHVHIPCAIGETRLSPEPVDSQWGLSYSENVGSLGFGFWLSRTTKVAG